MTSGLFLDGIFDENHVSPSKVKLVFTQWVGNRAVRTSMCGLLASEPTISTSNKWGPVIQNIEHLQSLSSIMGMQSMFNWIGASVLCWKGTSPISFPLDFYLINYKRNDLNLEEKLEALTKLTALAEVTTKDTTSKVTVAVHGGYAANKILTDNSSMFSNEGHVSNTGKFFDAVNAAINQDTNLVFAGNNSEDGILTVQIGRKALISNLLVSRVDVTPSIAEVEEGKALWYRVNMTVTGSRPLLTTDIDGMYTGKGKGGLYQ